MRPLALLIVLGLSACTAPPPQVATATPAQVTIAGSPITGPVDLASATAAAQARCREHGRDARYTGMIDTGSMWWGPVPTRVFDCVDAPRDR